VCADVSEELAAAIIMVIEVGAQQDGTAVVCWMSVVYVCTWAMKSWSDSVHLGEGSWKQWKLLCSS
jgi:hypothetical protein